MKNWRTTLAGLFGAIVNYAVVAVQSGQPVNAKALAAGLPMLILGYLAKDHGVSGTGA